MCIENIQYDIIDNINLDGKISTNLTNLLLDIEEELTTRNQLDLCNDDFLREDNYEYSNFEEYETYNVPDLVHILNYYQIQRRKMIKIDMIQAICLFEYDSQNIDIVTKRLKLWTFLIELKNDKYLSKFIAI